MGFGQAVSTCFSKYVDFSGRACRSEYWYWTLFTFLVSIAGNFLGVAVDSLIAGLVLQLALFLPGLAVFVRRLHDIDKSGWWFFLNFVPIIGFIIVLIWLVKRGTDGPNRFGDDPFASAASEGETAAQPA